MENKNKIYVVGRSTEYANWLSHQLVKNIEEADLVLFTGGEDVSPELYNEPAHYTTYNNSIRDDYEMKEFHKAKELNKPMLGICRGSQFLCVMSGGKLVQHQQNKHSYHKIYMWEGEEMLISSTHHQAQYPFNLPKEDYKILGWTNNLSEYHYNGAGEELNPEVECEIVYYPKTKSLGIQGHPEYMPYNSPTNIRLRKLINNFLNENIK